MTKTLKQTKKKPSGLRSFIFLSILMIVGSLGTVRIIDIYYPDHAASAQTTLTTKPTPAPTPEPLTRMNFSCKWWKGSELEGDGGEINQGYNLSMPTPYTLIASADRDKFHLELMDNKGKEFYDCTGKAEVGRINPHTHTFTREKSANVEFTCANWGKSTVSGGKMYDAEIHQILPKEAMTSLRFSSRIGESVDLTVAGRGETYFQCTVEAK